MIGIDDTMLEPERTEVFDVLLQLRRFGLTWANGAYEDQPCLLIKELNAAISAEEEHAARKAINQRNKEKFDATKRSS
jgi:hypothetical protein